MNFYFKKCTVEDCKILDLILEEFGVQQRLSKSLKEEDFILNGFNTSPAWFEVVFVFNEENDDCVGMSLYRKTFSTGEGEGIYIEDLYVRPSYQRKGLGKMIMSYMAKVALESGCKSMTHNVLDWNKEAIKFYDSIGGEDTKESLKLERYQIDKDKFID